METKIVKVKIVDRILKVTLDLAQGLNTQFEFAPLSDEWDLDFSLQDDDDDFIRFEDGSILNLYWDLNSPVGVFTFTTSRSINTHRIWFEPIPVAVIRVGLDGQFEIFKVKKS